VQLTHKRQEEELIVLFQFVNSDNRVMIAVTIVMLQDFNDAQDGASKRLEDCVQWECDNSLVFDAVEVFFVAFCC
jgi:hypothetical protein